MKKATKIALRVMACVFVLAILAGAMGCASNKEEYKLGDDVIKSVTAVVGERKANSVSTSTSNGITTKSTGYLSDTVTDDLIAYTEYLRGEGGFALTQDMDLSVVPSTVHLAKESVDEGKIIMMTIEYDAFGYTIILQKGEGTLNLY